MSGKNTGIIALGAAQSELAQGPTTDNFVRRTSWEDGMKYFLSLLFACVLASAAHSQDSPYRKEMKRSDLTGTNMEVITSFQEMKPGDVGFLHIHHGEEAYYFTEGGMIETPDGKQMAIPTGTAGINRRDMPHGAFKVVGDKPLKFITVHIVDKGAPLYDKPK
jgi:mannose-6-phosphate isomerase-like protein (cupin superfamily)